jgi:hypothetical protein
MEQILLEHLSALENFNLIGEGMENRSTCYLALAVFTAWLSVLAVQPWTNKIFYFLELWSVALGDSGKCHEGGLAKSSACFESMGAHPPRKLSKKRWAFSKGRSLPAAGKVKWQVEGGFRVGWRVRTLSHVEGIGDIHQRADCKKAIGQDSSTSKFWIAGLDSSLM